MKPFTVFGNRKKTASYFLDLDQYHFFLFSCRKRGVKGHLFDKTEETKKKKKNRLSAKSKKDFEHWNTPRNKFNIHNKEYSERD